jgi:hypothetical protein
MIAEFRPALCIEPCESGFSQNSSILFALHGPQSIFQKTILALDIGCQLFLVMEHPIRLSIPWLNRNLSDISQCKLPQPQAHTLPDYPWQSLFTPYYPLQVSLIRRFHCLYQIMCHGKAPVPIFSQITDNNPPRRFRRKEGILFI